MCYYDNEAGETALIFLHGWGQSFATFTTVVEAFQDRYRIIGVDFMGFGNSSQPSEPLTLDDYVSQLHTLIRLLHITDPILVGHSFGGRVAIRYSSLHPPKKLILISTAGIRKHGIRYYYRISRYKILKRIYKLLSETKYQALISSSGSEDFQNAPPVMKKTLSNIVGLRQTRDMKKIGTETYLIWGVHDHVTPYTDGIAIRKLISTSKLIPFYQSGHFSYLQETGKFIKTLEKII